MKEEYKGVVENITHSIVVDGITYTTPVYDVEYTCYFNDGKFEDLICDRHKDVRDIPHENALNVMCTGEDFDKIINEAYPDKELIHLVCERFFRQYNEKDSWGTPMVLSMCGFKIKYRGVCKGNFKRFLEEYDYYYIRLGYPILKLTHDCKDKLIGRLVYFIKRRQQ